MRYGDWRKVEKWRGVDTPVGGWLYGDPGKIAYVVYFGVGVICKLAQKMA